MTFLGGADEIIIGAVELSQHVAEHGGVLVRELNRLDAFLLGGLLHLLAMLIGAGQEEHVLSVKPLKPRQHIGRDRRVGVTDMRHPVGVEDRCGDIETFGAHGRLQLQYRGPDRQSDPCPLPS